MRKINWILFLTVILCMTGCGTDESENGQGAGEALSCRQVDCAYALKQIGMFNGETGWALSAENEMLFTREGAGNFTVVREIGETGESFVNASFVDEETVYLVYFSPDSPSMTVEYTWDGGAAWQKTLVDYGGFGDACDGGSAYLGFQDKEQGYLLYCSTPGAGLMTKVLLETKDGGKSFSVVKDLSEEIAGYPQGLAFSGNRGYIAVSYHGQDDYLYMSRDGGVTWESEKIDLADRNVRYINGGACAFSAGGSRGMIVLEEVGDKSSFQLFATEDGGGSWTEAGEIACKEVRACSHAGDAVFFFINELGQLYEAAP